jgi:hypothetical protein
VVILLVSRSTLFLHTARGYLRRLQERLRPCGYTQTVHVVVGECRSHAIQEALRCLRKPVPDNGKRDAITDTSPDNAQTLQTPLQSSSVEVRAQFVSQSLLHASILFLVKEHTRRSYSRIRQVPLDPTFLVRVTQS